MAPAKGLLYKNYVYGQHTLALRTNSQDICAAGDNSVGQFGSGTNISTYQFYCSVEVPAGIETAKIPDQINLKVFPNPVSSIVNIQMENAEFKHSQVIVSNINGQVLYNENDINGIMFSIDMATYPKGIYLLKVKSESGVSVTKLVKL